MKILKLTRFEQKSYGTIGALIGEGFGAFTVERPWLDNQPFLSCVPEGVYICQRYHSAKYPDTFEVMDVEGRDNILFHPANFPDEVSGCIAPGESYGYVNGKLGVQESRTAFKKLMDHMEGDKEFALIIERTMT